MKVLRIVFVAFLLIGMERAVSSQADPDRPFLVSSTFWGGSSTEEFATVVVDAAGNVYVAGSTSSSDFPRTVSTLPSLGVTNIFISKFDPAGNLIFSTTFGGSRSDRVNAMAVDAAGNIILVGATISPDFPVVNAIQPAFHMAFCGEFGGICGDGFLAKIDSTGQQLLLSTYLGSPSSDDAVDVAVDGAGNIYVSGTTESRTFEGATPLREFGGGRDAFVAKIPLAGRAFEYFTYLGGTQDESGSGIAVDSTGNAFVTGGTGSQNYPTLNPIQAGAENNSTSAFVTKLDPTGVLAYSTYLGGHASDSGVDIAVDATGAAFVAGNTASTNFPTVNAQQPFLRGDNDVFVAKLSASGSSLVYSTYLGGNHHEQVFLDIISSGLDIAIDGAGNAYVGGTTQSVDFPAVFAFFPFGGGTCNVFPFRTEPCPDAFITKLDPEGKLTFSTPIGGNNDDRGRGVAVAQDGTVYVAGVARSAGFPVKAPIQQSLSGFSDAFIAKISTATPACQLLAPTNLSPAGGTFEERPTFSWEAVPGAETYAVLLSRLGFDMLTGTPPVQLLGVTSATSLTPAEPLLASEYLWAVVPQTSACSAGRSSSAVFTLPATCPIAAATQLSPQGGATVDNPIRLEWQTSGPSLVTLSLVVIFTTEGRFVGRYATVDTSFSIPFVVGLGDYEWVVLTWNSLCGAAVSEPARFRSSGRIAQ